jgi:hypothetical protein
MSRMKLDSPDDLANASLELSSPSRRRFLLDTAALAAALTLGARVSGRRPRRTDALVLPLLRDLSVRSDRFWSRDAADSCQ